MAPLRIETLDVEDIRAAVRHALQSADKDVLADFLASVDWGGVEDTDPAIRELLGQLELLNTEFAEGALSRDDYEAALGSVCRAYAS